MIAFGGIHGEVVLAAGYAVVLLLVACGLEWMARHTHQRSHQYRTAGFKYLKQFDMWECPSGQHLRRTAIEHGHRVARYRAPANVCNACPIKGHCTDGDDGREIVRSLDPWLETDIGRFHRGISLALLLLATLLIGVVLVRHHTPNELLVLGGVLASIGAIGVRLLWAFGASHRDNAAAPVIPLSPTDAPINPYAAPQRKRW